MLSSKVTNVVTCIGIATFSAHKLHAKDMVACHDCHMRRLPKARELPLYDKTEENFTAEYDEKSKLPLMSEISVVRKELSSFLSYLDVFQSQAKHIYETGLAHSQSTYEFLKDEENKIPRILIIASGGLAGYLYARKGRILKKLLYTTIGTGAMFSVFYPSVTKEYFSSGFNYTKDQTSNILKNYGGYDTEKMFEDANAKIQSFKSAVMFDSFMETLNELLYKSKHSGSESDAPPKAGVEEEKKTDQDLYTTRTAA